MTDEQFVDTAEGENARKRWPLIRRSHGFYRSEDGTMEA
ncbi:hypothetical protein EDF58_107121 [Novosphingobium sp. PhB57]|nr:hypothetical protein EDF58_107121 [Novosphingobium sp. PhB57]